MTPQTPSTPGRTPSSLPVVALVFSVVGICLPPLLLVGVVLGVIALVQAKGSQAQAIVAVVLPVLAVPVFGILAAIAIPNFVKYGARSKQSEAKVNLKAAFTGARAYQQETGKWSLHPAEVGFAPERGNRYLYVFSATGPLEGRAGPTSAGPGPEDVGVGVDTFRNPAVTNDQLLNGIPDQLRSTLGIVGECPKCELTIAAAGNLDGDPTIDVWSISTAERPGIPAGTPHNHTDDTRD